MVNPELRYCEDDRIPDPDPYGGIRGILICDYTTLQELPPDIAEQIRLRYGPGIDPNQQPEVGRTKKPVDRWAIEWSAMGDRDLGLSFYEQTVRTLSLSSIYSKSSLEEKGSIEADQVVRVEETVGWELGEPRERARSDW